MANFYKSDTFDLTTTNLTTVLTINASSIAIVRSVQVIAHKLLNKTTENLVVPVVNILIDRSQENG
jgi:hypothetical protein